MGQGLFQMCGYLSKLPHELGNTVSLDEYDMEEEQDFLKSAWNEKTKREKG